MVGDLTGLFHIICERRCQDDVPGLLQPRQLLFRWSITLNRQHAISADARQDVALQKLSKLSAPADNQYRTGTGEFHRLVGGSMNAMPYLAATSSLVSLDSAA